MHPYVDTLRARCFAGTTRMRNDNLRTSVSDGIATPLRENKRLSTFAYERVLDMIVSGQIKAGSIIRERQLAEVLQVSRTPLRDALLMLEGEGLLVRHEPRMLQVKYMTAEDYVQNLHVRRLLETEAARLATGRMDPDLLVQLRARLVMLMERAEPRDLPIDRGEHHLIDDELHDGIAGAAGNPQMAKIIRDLRRKTRMFDLRRMPERFIGSCREHVTLIDAMLRNNPDDAAAAMAEHIDQVKRSIIERVGSL
jgi:DNA-binding GntR family transcriptional regulator